MTKKKTNKKKSIKAAPKKSGQDCPDGVCPIKKPKSKKTTSKQKDINVVVPIPAPIPIAVPVTIPTNLDILKKIKNKIFSTFGFGPQ